VSVETDYDELIISFTVTNTIIPATVPTMAKPAANVMIMSPVVAVVTLCASASGIANI